MKEGAKAPEISLAELNEAWYDLFGHHYNHCVQLSKIEGEIGQIHRGHIEYVCNLASKSALKASISAPTPKRS